MNGLDRFRTDHHRRRSPAHLDLAGLGLPCPPRHQRPADGQEHRRRHRASRRRDPALHRDPGHPGSHREVPGPTGAHAAAQRVLLTDHRGGADGAHQRCRQRHQDGAGPAQPAPQGCARRLQHLPGRGCPRRADAPAPPPGAGRPTRAQPNGRYQADLGQLSHFGPRPRLESPTPVGALFVYSSIVIISILTYHMNNAKSQR